MFEQLTEEMMEKILGGTEPNDIPDPDDEIPPN